MAERLRMQESFPHFVSEIQNQTEIESAENDNSDVEDDVENASMEMQVAGRHAYLEMQRAITCGICASISRPEQNQYFGQTHARPSNF